MSFLSGIACFRSDVVHVEVIMPHIVFEWHRFEPLLSLVSPLPFSMNKTGIECLRRRGSRMLQVKTLVLTASGFYFCSGGAFGFLALTWNSAKIF